MQVASLAKVAQRAGEVRGAHTPHASAKHLQLPRCAEPQPSATTPLLHSSCRTPHFPVSAPHVLICALPAQIVVVKYGGHAMADITLADQFAADVAMLQSLGLRPVVVHGGGPQIGAMLEKMEIESRFENGLRVTDEATMGVAEMVLAGSLNKKIAAAITQSGGEAIGLTGRDGALVKAQQKDAALGLVGEPTEVRPDLLRSLLDAGITPVLAPIGYGEGGVAYNINADTMAGCVAEALQAKSLLLLTDVEGVLDGPGGKLLPRLSVEEAGGLIASGVAVGGMIPKLETAMGAVQKGVGSAVVMDGRVPHCTLIHLFGENAVGTTITNDQ